LKSRGSRLVSGKYEHFYIWMAKTQSPRSVDAPHAIVEIEVLEACELGHPEFRAGDIIRRPVGAIVGGVARNDRPWYAFGPCALRPFVRVAVDGFSQETSVKTVSAENTVHFQETLILALFRPLLTNAKLQMDVSVHDKRVVPGISGHPRIGWSTIELTSSSIGTTSICLNLYRASSKIRCRLMLRYRVQELMHHYKLLGNTPDHGLFSVVRAFSRILNAGNGVELLLHTMPEAVSGRSRSQDMRCSLKHVLALLADQCEVGNSFSKTNDDVAVDQFGAFAREILHTVAKFVESDACVLDTSKEWIRRLHAHCLQTADEEEEDDTPSDDRLHRFFAEANVCVEDLQAMDHKFETVSANDLWTSVNVPDSAVLGTGSFGCVWRARDRYTGKMFAIKTLKVSDEGNLAIAKRESQVAHWFASHRHPCVVSLHHFFHDQTRHLFFLVLEFCVHGDLESFIHTTRINFEVAGLQYQAPEKSFAWIAQVFLGIEHCHLRMRTMLRDIKPANVVISHTKVAKLTDFGLARRGIEKRGHFTFAAYHIPAPGSPAYVAPEVVLGGSYGIEADLYSFGVTCWVLLTGGVTNQIDIRPPCHHFSSDNLLPLSNNWKLLKACILAPKKNNAIALPGGEDGHAGSFVLSLIDRSEGRRFLNHREIRDQPLLQSIHIPKCDASAEVLSSWLRQ